MNVQKMLFLSMKTEGRDDALGFDLKIVIFLKEQKI